MPSQRRRKKKIIYSPPLLFYFLPADERAEKRFRWKKMSCACFSSDPAVSFIIEKEDQSKIQGRHSAQSILALGQIFLYFLCPVSR